MKKIGERMINTIRDVVKHDDEHLHRKVRCRYCGTIVEYGDLLFVDDFMICPNPECLEIDLFWEVVE